MGKLEKYALYFGGAMLAALSLCGLGALVDSMILIILGILACTAVMFSTVIFAFYSHINPTVLEDEPEYFDDSPE